jgi:hypothetical protein
MKKSWQRCMRSMALAGVLGNRPVLWSRSGAARFGKRLGSGHRSRQGGVVYSQIDKELKYYNNTEEGAAETAGVV